MKEMKNTALFKQQVEKIDMQASNKVRQVDSGNSRVTECQRNLKIQEPLPKNNIAQLLFPTIKRAHARPRIDLGSNQNEPLYDVAQYEQSANCKRPQSCNAIFQSLLNTNELDPQLMSNLPWSTASTPCMNTPRNARYREVVRYVSQLNQPYRTVSHFGFNSPTRQPQPEHKHIPQNAPRSGTLAAACSYEDVYGSPRYVDLCNQCYEQLLRLKTDFIPVRTRLRNLADIPKSSVEPTAESSGQTLIYETAAVTEPAVGLETVLEVDENQKTSDVSVCVETLKNEQEAQNSKSQSSFERRISNFNFSKESTNIHYEPPLIADSVLSMEIQSFNEHGMEPAEEEQTQIVEECNCQVEILELIEFGNWMKADGVQDCQYRSSSETQMVDIKSPTVLEHSSDDSDDVSMTRNERMERKKEFQEIWEDHINFFTGKEIALLDEIKKAAEEIKGEELLEKFKKEADADAGEEEEQECTIEEISRSSSETAEARKDAEIVEEEECPIEEISRSSSELDVSGSVFEKEVFLGCSLIVNNLKSEPSEESLAHTQQIARQSTPFFLAVDIQAPAAYDLLPDHNDSLAMVDTSKQSEFLSHVDSEQSFNRMNFNTTQTSDNEDAADASDEVSLNSIECEILEKIFVHNLKEQGEIFEKIDRCVRAKLTPRRLHESIVQEPEQPTTSAQAIRNMSKQKEQIAQTERLNVVSSCSTFSIPSNKEDTEEEEEAAVVEKKSKTSNSSNTSIFSRQIRGKRTKRNFIRENIKNASKPRILKSTPLKCNENPSAVFCPCPFGDAKEQPVHKRRKQQQQLQESTSSTSSMDSPLYSFQKQQKQSGVQSLWMSMSPAGGGSSKRRSSTDNSAKTTNSIRRKLFTGKQMKRRRASATACSSSLLKLTPLRGIGLKPLAKYPTKRAKIVELAQNSDKENIVDSVESQDNHYYTAESIEVQSEKTVVEEEIVKEAGMSLEELRNVASSFSVDEVARVAVLKDYIQELLYDLIDSDEK